MFSTFGSVCDFFFGQLFRARQAWQKLGAMPPEEAMQKYIDIVTELYPSWLAGSTLVRNFMFYHLAFFFDTRNTCLLAIGLFFD